MLTESIVAAIDDALPRLADDVLRKAGLCVLDALACAGGGREFPWSVAARRVVPPLPAPGATGTVWSDGTAAGTADAVYVNSVMAHSVVQEDMHPASRSHLGTMVVPAALAVAEERGSTGREVLEAVVAGYEAAVRVAEHMTTPDFVARGLRPSSMFGPFGVAMTTARLLRLDRAATVAALGLAGSAAAGTCAWAYGGTPDVYFQNGAAARGGVVAAQLAALGVAGTPAVLEGPAGLLEAFSGRPAGPVVPSAHPGWAITDVYFKPFPSCAFTQEAAEAARRLVAAGLHHEDVRGVEVATYGMGKRYPGCDNAWSLETTLERQMSNQFAVAAVLVDGGLTLDRYLGPLPAVIAELAARIEVREDPGFEADYPALPTTRLVVTTRAGRRIEQLVRGDVGLAPAGVVAKFHRYTADHLGAAGAAAVVAAVEGLAAAPSVDDLLAPFRAGARIGGVGVTA